MSDTRNNDQLGYIEKLRAARLAKRYLAIKAAWRDIDYAFYGGPAAVALRRAEWRIIDDPHGLTVRLQPRLGQNDKRLLIVDVLGRDVHVAKYCAVELAFLRGACRQQRCRRGWTTILELTPSEVDNIAALTLVDVDGHRRQVNLAHIHTWAPLRGTRVYYLYHLRRVAAQKPAHAIARGLTAKPATTTPA